MKRKISSASTLSAVSDDFVKFGWYSILKSNWYGILKSNWYGILKLVNTKDQVEGSDHGGTLHRFDWPGLRKACERWVNACLACLQVKDPRKLKFPLKSVESSEFNEVVLIDHQKICMKET